MEKIADGIVPGCGRCVCPYCGNDEVDSDTRDCCDEVHAFICGEHGAFCDECQEMPIQVARIARIRRRQGIKWPIGQLRHLYTQMINGYVTPAGMKNCAEYLLAPVIRQLEEHQKELDLSQTFEVGSIVRMPNGNVRMIKRLMTDVEGGVVIDEPSEGISKWNVSELELL